MQALGRALLWQGLGVTISHYDFSTVLSFEWSHCISISDGLDNSQSTQEHSSKKCLFLVCMSPYFDLAKRKGKISHVSTFFSRYPQIFGLNRTCNIQLQYVYLVGRSRSLKVLRAMVLLALDRLLEINSASLKDLLIYIDYHGTEEECLTNNCFNLYFVILNMSFMITTERREQKS